MKIIRNPKKRQNIFIWEKYLKKKNDFRIKTAENVLNKPMGVWVDWNLILGHIITAILERRSYTNMRKEVKEKKN